jgi:hypothetical protein
MRQRLQHYPSPHLTQFSTHKQYFNHLISDYTVYYTRHRQRRHVPFITNPHYLAPDILLQCPITQFHHLHLCEERHHNN